MTPVNNWWWLVLLLVMVGLLERVDGAVPFGGKIYDDPAFCEGRVSAYLVSDNVNINSSASFVMRNISESRCLDLCSANRDSKGRWVFCASVIYDRDRDICAIHRRGSAPDGSAEREPESGKRYFEKFCLPEDLPLDCADRQFVRVDQFILKGYAQTTASFSTMAECAAHCVREKKFQCKSAMYFYEEGECIINTESAITRPDDFMRPDDDDKVVFFHNGCIGSRHNREDDRLEEITTAAQAINVTEPSPPTRRFSSPTSISRAHKTLPIGKNVRKAEPKRQHTLSQLKPSSVNIEESTDAGEPIATTTSTETTARSRPNLVRRTKPKSDIPHSTTTPTTTMAPTTPTSTASENPKGDDSEHASGEGKFAVSKEDVSRSEEIDPEKFRAPKISIDAPKRLYGAKALERAEDGSLRESTFEDRPIKANDGEGEPSKAASAEPRMNKHTSTASTSTPNPSISYVDAHKTKVHKSLGVVDAGESSSASPKRLRLKSIKQSPISPPTESTTPSAPLHLDRRDVVVKSNSHPRPAILNTSAGGGSSGAFDEEGDSGFFSKWGAWTQCTEPGERRVRRRRCLDLRRCKGALMQVDYCPQDTKALPTDSGLQEEGPTPPPPVRNPLPINAPEQNGNGGSPPSILPPKLPDRELKPLPEGAPGSPNDVWSPWQGACQRFASPQPCTRHEMIGFESRECIAKDPAACKGPFFRYCRLPC